MTGSCPDGPWVKALAVQDGIDQTDDTDLVVADADVWCDGLDEALSRLADRPVVIPHGQVVRLTPEATAAVLAGDPPRRHKGSARTYRGYEGGGILILRRDVWDRVPLDPRFVGWGQEDSAWAHALTAMTGKICRFSAPLYHLWHPPQERLNRHTGTLEGLALNQRYEEHRHNPTEMAELLDEAKDAARRMRCSPPSTTSRTVSAAP